MKVIALTRFTYKDNTVSMHKGQIAEIADSIAQDLIKDKFVEEYSEGGGGGSDLAGYLTNTLEIANLSGVTTIKTGAFGVVSPCDSLVEFHAPDLQAINQASYGSVFVGPNKSLKVIDVKSYPGVLDDKLATNDQAPALETLIIPSVTEINTAFSMPGCKNLKELYLGGSAVVPFTGIDSDYTWPEGTPFGSGEGRVYVPFALVDAYKAADIWKTMADGVIVGYDPATL